MKNQTAKFTSETESTLTISARQGKKDWVISYRLRTPGEKPRVGKDFVELSREDEAQQQFDKRVKEAVANGWSLSQCAERAAAFSAIPQAPKSVTAGAPTTAPRAAARR